ncbi:MAG: Fic family protein [Deltaproteobacteria bacterium]|nr:Fic family protein [Deltaproteobacteria bacterium]
MRYIWQEKSWPRLTWDSKRLIEPLGKARRAQGELIARVSALGLASRLEAQADLVSEEALKTAAIEGEKLNPLSVRSSVARRLGLPTAGLPPTQRAVDGLVEVLLDATANYDKPLTCKRIKGWQAALFPTGYSGFHRIAVGRWRKHDPMQVLSGPIGREKIHFEAPPSNRVEKEMGKFLVWWNKSIKESPVEGLIRGGMAHFYFVAIHPFEDGNGRIARALTDMALAQDEKMSDRFYSLSSQIMTERDAYYAVLEKTSKGNGDITEWLLWFVSCVERAIGRSEKLLERILGKVKFWQDHAATSINAHQRKVINRLLDAGEGGFEGGLTTRKYVSLAKVSRATAYREMDDLVAKKILVSNSSGGRSTSYRLVWK